MQKGLKNTRTKIHKARLKQIASRRINNKATKSKTNTGTAILYKPTNFTLGPDATLNHN